MRRIDRDPERFEVLNLYDVLGRNLGLKIDDPESKSKLTTGQFVMSPEGARKTPRLLATLG